MVRSEKKIVVIAGALRFQAEDRLPHISMGIDHTMERDNRVLTKKQAISL